MFRFWDLQKMRKCKIPLGDSAEWWPQIEEGGGGSPQGIEKFYAFIGKVDSIGDKGINVL